MAEIRVSDDVALLLVDGVDPTAALARALDLFRNRAEDGRG